MSALEMLLSEPYNETVREYFHSAAHAGDLSREYPQVLESVAAESGQGARIALSVGVEDGLVGEMRFRVWGCPHLIAAAEWLCEQRESGPVSALKDLPLPEIMRQLSVPVEKTGRILLLEDALKSLVALESSAE
jgi:NifU-like protein involved in Fe-S cluster formation